MKNYVRTAMVTMHQSREYAHIEVRFGCSPEGEEEPALFERFAGYDTEGLKDQYNLQMAVIQSQQNKPGAATEGYPAYAWGDGLCVQTYGRTDLNEIKAAHKFLTDVNNKMSRVVKVEGQPHTFGLMVKYLCRVLKIKQVSVESLSLCGAYYSIGGRYMIKPNEIAEYIDRNILLKNSDWSRVTWNWRP